MMPHAIYLILLNKIKQIKFLIMLNEFRIGAFQERIE